MDQRLVESEPMRIKAAVFTYWCEADVSHPEAAPRHEWSAAGHVTEALYVAATWASSGRDPFDPDAT